MFHTYYFYIALLPSIILHEVSHGWVANFFGDPTAKNAKRLSLNPMRHIDPFGTILLPALLIALHFPPFGYARPVPVNVVAPSQAASAVALRVAGRSVRQHRPLGDRTVVSVDLAVHTSAALIYYHTHRSSTSAWRWASRTCCSPPSTCSRFRRSTARPSSSDSCRTSTSAPTTTGALAPCRSSWRFVILSEYVFHFGSNAWFGDLQNWWIGLLR